MLRVPVYLPRMNKHRLSSAALVAVCLGLLSACASFPESGVDRIRESVLAFPELPPSLEGYRLVFVSDIHFGNNFSRERLDRLVASINALSPDCVVLGGDHTLGYAEIREFAEAAGKLRAKEGVYAVLGNHDFYNGRRESVDSLREQGIVVLDETLVKTPRGLTLAGINDFRDVFPVMGRMRDILDKREFTVLASHNPDFAEKTDLSYFDLVLSGHTHGGQITFFGYAPVLPSEYGQRYRTGTVLTGGVPVVVSNGAGFGGMRLRFRFGAPSDFLLITLRSTVPTSGR